VRRPTSSPTRIPVSASSRMMRGSRSVAAAASIAAICSLDKTSGRFFGQLESGATARSGTAFPAVSETCPLMCS
jgi:hypothetical protein